MKEIQLRGWSGLLRPSYKATSASNLGLSLTLKKANHNVMNCPIERTKCHRTKRGVLSTAGGEGVGWQRELNLDACVSLGAVSPSVKPSDEIAAEADALAAAHDRNSARGTQLGCVRFLAHGRCDKM